MNTLNSTLMKSLFAFAFLLGAALILYSKLQLQSIPLAIAAPNLIICAYAALVASQPKVHRSASDADNLYYLGFLFTVVSLGSTLFTFDANDSSSLANTLIPSFGIALSTTIVGLLFRTLLLPHVIDIGQQDQAARIQLYEATNEFIKALSSNTQKLNEAFDGNTVRLAQAFEVAADAVGTSLPKEADQLTRVLQDFNVQTGFSLGATLEEIQKFPIAIKQTTENLDVEHSKLLMDNMRIFQETAAGFMEVLKTNNEQIGKVGTAIERLRARIEEVQVDPQLLNTHVGQVYEIYQRAADSAANGFAKSSETFAHGVSSYTTATQQLKEQVTAIATSLAQLDASRVGGLIEAALEPIHRATQALLSHAQRQAEEQHSMRAEFGDLIADLRSRQLIDEPSVHAEAQAEALTGSSSASDGTRLNP
jgi:hypothetical protein